MLKKIVISLIVMCFSMGFFITPAHASDDKHACPVGVPSIFTDTLIRNPYWIDISFDNVYPGSGNASCTGVQHYYILSDKPIVVEQVTVDNREFWNFFINGVFIYYLDGRYVEGTLKARSVDLTRKTIVTNHDVVTKDGDIVFPKPPAPVDPEIPIVVPGEEMWTVVLDLIYRSALTILVVGLLLMGLWISLRLLSKVLKIFSSRF